MWLPLAIRVGVGYSEFWDMTPFIIKLYVDKQNKKREYEEQRLNTTAWLTGLYVKVAIGSSLSSDVDYPDTPFGEEKEDDLTTKDHVERFGLWADIFNKNFENKNPKGIEGSENNKKEDS